MVNREIVITGVGVVASNGIGRDAFADAIFSSRSGIGPISIFDASAYASKLAAEVRAFDPVYILGQKGLRTLDRTTKLALSAAKLAMDDASLVVDENNGTQVGVSLASTLGCVKSVCDFDKEALKDGPRYVNPALFPNTVLNSPASQISIRFHIKGFNSTISTGFSAGIDAIGYAADLLSAGRARIALAGGVEEFCLETFLGFYKAGLLEAGVILGEASAILVLEDLDSALERKAKIYARIKGYGTAFGECKKVIAASMNAALENSGVAKEKIDSILVAANSSKLLDEAESAAITDVFGKQKIATSAIKSMTGECYSASGALQAAAATLAIEKQTAENILMNAGCPGKAFSSLIISK